MKNIESKIVIAITFFLMLFLESARCYPFSIEKRKINQPEGNSTQNFQDVSDAEPLYQTNLTLNTKQGAIAFWIKPSNSNQSEINIFSASVPTTNEPAYMTLSQDWWNGKSEKGLYFVIDNSQSDFCVARRLRLQPESWSQIIVSWGSEHGNYYCRIYINGDIRSESKLNKPIEKNTVKFAAFSDVYTDNPIARTMIGKTSSWLVFPDIVGSEFAKRIFNASKERYLPLSESALSSYMVGRSAQNGPYPDEQRVLFDEDIYWARSRKNTDEVIALLKRGKFNVFVPCVWHGNGTYFKSNVAIAHKELQDRIDRDGEDPLAYLIEQAHKNGIKIYPWFTVVLNESNQLDQYATAGIDGAFDIHNQEFRTFIVKLVSDAAERYPIDGINLDYIRSMGICLTDSCKTAFKSYFEKNLEIEAKLAILKKHTIGDIDNSPIAKWNSESINSILFAISSKIRESNPKAIISVDSHPLDLDFSLQGQNSLRWLNEGYIDRIFSMDYALDIDVENLDSAKKHSRYPDKIIPLFSSYDKIGSSIVPRSPETVERYIKLTRLKWPNTGYAFYHRKQISSDQLNVFKALSENNAPSSDYFSK